MNVRVITSFQQAQWGRFRSVVEVVGAGDALGKIGVIAHARPGDDGTIRGEHLFAPATLERVTLLAEKCLEGDPAAISHPKTILMLAATLVAVIATITAVPGGDDETGTDAG